MQDIVDTKCLSLQELVCTEFAESLWVETCPKTVPGTSQPCHGSQQVPGQSCAGTDTLGCPPGTTRGCVRTTYAGHNSHTLIFPPTWNYSRFSLSLTAVGSLSQHAFPRLYLSPVIRQQYEPVETFRTSAFWQPKCEGRCQVLRLSHGDFSRATLSCLFFICSVTATQWRQGQPHPAGQHSQGMCARDTPSGHAHSNWAGKVRLLVTYSQSWNWPWLL